MIGVTAADYQDPFGPPEVWLPVTSPPNANWLTRDNPSFWAVGLLKPGVSRAQGAADLSAIAGRSPSSFRPPTPVWMQTSLQTLRDYPGG